MSKKRIKKTRLLRGMLHAGLITEKDVPLVEKKLNNYDIGMEVNRFYWEKKGWRVVERIKSLGRWIWENREMLLRILGIIVMFADDGTPTVRDADDDNVGDKTEEEHEVRMPDAKDEVAPPEEVEDFTDQEAFGEYDAEPLREQEEADEQACCEEGCEECQEEWEEEVEGDE